MIKDNLQLMGFLNCSYKKNGSLKRTHKDINLNYTKMINQANKLKRWAPSDDASRHLINIHHIYEKQLL